MPPHVRSRCDVVWGVARRPSSEPLASPFHDCGGGRIKNMERGAGGGRCNRKGLRDSDFYFFAKYGYIDLYLKCCRLLIYITAVCSQVLCMGRIRAKWCIDGPPIAGPRRGGVVSLSGSPRMQLGGRPGGGVVKQRRSVTHALWALRGGLGVQS